MLDVGESGSPCGASKRYRTSPRGTKLNKRSYRRSYRSRQIERCGASDAGAVPSASNGLVVFGQRQPDPEALAVPSDVFAKDPTNLRRKLILKQPLSQLGNGLIKVGEGLAHNIERRVQPRRADDNRKHARRNTGVACTQKLGPRVYFCRMFTILLRPLDALEQDESRHEWSEEGAQDRQRQAGGSSSRGPTARECRP